MYDDFDNDIYLDVNYTHIKLHQNNHLLNEQSLQQLLFIF